jgi:hypothetical protein
MLQKKLGIEARSVVMIAEIIEHDSHCHVESLVFHFLLLNNNSKGKSTHTQHQSSESLGYASKLWFSELLGCMDD